MEADKTPYDVRECPVYGKVIDGELCYETALCMQGQFKISSIAEAKNIKIPIDRARRICQGCKYADME